MRFEDFAAARLPALLRYAALLCGDRELARDLVQDALIKALVRWKRIGAMDRPDAYVRTMVTNEFLSLRRRRAVRTVALTHDALEGPDAPHTPDHAAADVGDDLWRRLIGLPRQQRAVLVLRYYEGLSDDEIAETLDCRPGTVRGYASRALATLRVELTVEVPRTSPLPPLHQGEPA
ncbi:SigE family RNA polymerase sigma factor [Embleya sp. NPDC001921]